MTVEDIGLEQPLKTLEKGGLSNGAARNAARLKTILDGPPNMDQLRAELISLWEPLTIKSKQSVLELIRVEAAKQLKSPAVSYLT